MKEEQKYEQLKELGQELGIPIFETFLELEVRNKDGKLIQEHKQRSHSWVRNAFNAMFCNLAGKSLTDTTFGAGLLSLRRPDGWHVSDTRPFFYAHTGSLDTTAQGYRAPAGIATRGIIVGSGTLAESFEHVSLQTPIAEGTGAGQLNYVASNPHVITYDATTRVLRNALVRFFNNNSGGDVSVNEVGLIAFDGFHGHTFLVGRDVLPTTVVVPNTGQLRVTYTISLTYPAQETQLLSFSVVSQSG